MNSLLLSQGGHLQNRKQLELEGYDRYPLQDSELEYWCLGLRQHHCALSVEVGISKSSVSRWCKKKVRSQRNPERGKITQPVTSCDRGKSESSPVNCTFCISREMAMRRTRFTGESVVRGRTQFEYLVENFRLHQPAGEWRGEG